MDRTTFETAKTLFAKLDHLNEILDQLTNDSKRAQQDFTILIHFKDGTDFEFTSSRDDVVATIQAGVTASENDLKGIGFDGALEAEAAVDVKA